jgi:hypothetical protein
VQPGFAEAFLPGGKSPSPGELFRFPDHAATLEKSPRPGAKRSIAASWPRKWRPTRSATTA